jgi:hypothetical protein
LSTFFKPVTLIVAFSICGLIACQKSDDYKAPEIQAVQPKTDVVELKYNDLNTCDRSEEDLAAFLVDAPKVVLDVKDEIDTQDFEVRDCDGKVVKGAAPGPVRNLNQKVTIEPEGKLTGAVTSVQVGNFRTCALKSIFVSAESSVSTEKDSSSVKAVATEKNPPSAEKAAPSKASVAESIVSKLEPSGKLELALTDSTSKLEAGLNVRDGMNVLSVTYLGKCLKRDAALAGQPAESGKCSQFEELGHQVVVVHVNVKRPQIGGVNTIESCKLKDDSKKDDAKKDQPKVSEPKKDEPKSVDSKKADPKKSEPKKVEPKKEEPKKDEPTKEESKKDEPKKDDPKEDDSKKPEPKKEDPKPAKPKAK